MTNEFKAIETKVDEILKKYSNVKASIFYDGSVYFYIDGQAAKKEMLSAKRELIQFIDANKPEARRWIHAKSNGYRVFWWVSETCYQLRGLKCGVSPKLTEEEDLFVLRGGHLYK